MGGHRGVPLSQVYSTKFYFLYVLFSVFCFSSALIANRVIEWLLFYFLLCTKKVKLLINWEDVIRILLNFLPIFSICQTHDQEGCVECRVALDPGL